jgi:hypothetical protein
MTSSIQYDLIEKVGPVEIRRYPSLTLATVFDASDNVAFSILFDYISGKNEPNQRIAMTAPVLSQRPTGKRMAMTAPVISSESSFSFALPPEFNVQSAPRPKDRNIQIISVPSRLVAVVKFSGRAHEHDVGEEEKILMATLEEHGFQPKGETFLMRYNSPFTPGFMRHNELGIEIIDKDSH